MDMQLALLLTSVAVSVVAWSVVTTVYIWPALEPKPWRDAVRPILLLHAFRFVGLAFLIPGVVSPDLPLEFARPAAFGDLAAALLALLNPLHAADTSDENSQPVRHEIKIKDREVQLDSNVIRVTQGDDVELVWSSDEPVELHLHGYDIALEITADEPGTMSFNARATGRYPVTSHGFGGEHGHGHQTLLYVEVYPD